MKKVLLGLVFWSAVACHCFKAEAADLYVPSSMYATIQAAINAATTGDTAGLGC